MPRIYLNGCFRAEDERGAEVDLRSAKSQALLALLASCDSGARTRQWLQAKLWSDRAAEQASGSLRQELTQLRRHLRGTGIELIADRQRIRLDLDKVEVVTDGPDEFLEGMDIRDPEFEEWLTVQRQAANRAVPVCAAPHLPKLSDAHAIVVIPENTSGSNDNWFETIVADTIARSMRELFSLQIVIGDHPPGVKVRNVIRVQGFGSSANSIGLRVSLEDPDSRRQIWAAHRTLESNGAPPIEHPETMRLINELVQTFGDDLLAHGRRDRTQVSPDQLCRKAIRTLFRMNPQSLAEADQMFERAFTMEEKGLYMAWRAQARTIQFVEQLGADRVALSEEARYFAARAIEEEPNNSMVLATLANTFCHLLKEHDRSLGFAKRSVLLNPANPMAWWALSSANVYTGNLDASYRSAVHARNLAILSPHRFWWDNQLFAAAIVQRKLDEAISLAETAHSQNSESRPPLRFLIAFYANAGREEDALRLAEKLKEIEPEFSIDRLAHDPLYPASLIHRVPDINVDRIAALA